MSRSVAEIELSILSSCAQEIEEYIVEIQRIQAFHKDNPDEVALCYKSYAYTQSTLHSLGRAILELQQYLQKDNLEFHFEFGAKHIFEIKNIDKNLKWSDENFDQKVMLVFLESVAQMLFCFKDMEETVKKINAIKGSFSHSMTNITVDGSYKISQVFKDENGEVIAEHEYFSHPATM